MGGPVRHQPFSVGGEEFDHFDKRSFGALA